MLARKAFLRARVEGLKYLLRRLEATGNNALASRSRGHLSPVCETLIQISRKSYTTMEEKAKWMSGQMTKEKYKRFSSP